MGQAWDPGERDWNPDRGQTLQGVGEPAEQRTLGEDPSDDAEQLAEDALDARLEVAKAEVALDEARQAQQQR